MVRGKFETEKVSRVGASMDHLLNNACGGAPLKLLDHVLAWWLVSPCLVRFQRLRADQERQ